MKIRELLPYFYVKDYKNRRAMKQFTKEFQEKKRVIRK